MTFGPSFCLILYLFVFVSSVTFLGLCVEGVLWGSRSAAPSLDCPGAGHSRSRALQEHPLWWVGQPGLGAHCAAVSKAWLPLWLVLWLVGAAWWREPLWGMLVLAEVLTGGVTLGGPDTSQGPT